MKIEFNVSFHEINVYFNGNICEHPVDSSLLSLTQEPVGEVELLILLDLTGKQEVLV